MDKNYTLIKINMLFILTILYTNITLSQCSFNLSSEFADVEGAPVGITVGQSFIAECDGFLSSIGLISSSTSVLQSGVLNIYNDNMLIHTQSHLEMNLTSGTHITLDISSDVLISENETYRFELILNNTLIYVVPANIYPDGQFYVNGIPQPSKDAIFNYSITNSSLSQETYEDIKENAVVYPNPATSVITIKGFNRQEKFILYDILGIKIREGAINDNLQINITNLKNGIYFIRFEEKGIIKKFIKK